MRDMREVRPAVLLAALPRPRVPRARGHVRNRDDVGRLPRLRPGAAAVLDVRAPRLCVIFDVTTVCKDPLAASKSLARDHYSTAPLQDLHACSAQRLPSVRTVYGPVWYGRRPLGSAVRSGSRLSILWQPHRLTHACVCKQERRRCLDERRSCSLAQQQRRRGRRGTHAPRRTPTPSRASSRAIQQTKCWRSSLHRWPTTRTLPTERRSCSSRPAPPARRRSGGQLPC